MGQKKFAKGFFLGMITTLIIGGAVWKVQDIQEAKRMNQGVITESFVDKAKLIEKLVNEKYTGEIDEKLMEEDMYKGLMASLGDPYSAYYTPDEYEHVTAESTGAYKGIGVVMQQRMDTGEVKIVRCYEGAPGERAGLLPEDTLLEVDKESIAGMELSEIVKKIKTSENDTVLLKIAREGEDDFMEFEMPLEEVNIPVVKHEMLEDNIGYIALYEFTEQTLPQYKEAFEDLKKQGMERLIVDVRNNPGGLLSSVSDLLENMLPKGLIVYTEDKEGKRTEIKSSGKHELQMPLAVLVNGNSASASEIFSGAIQDYGIGEIVGTTTFGKGIVQSIVPLTDGSAVKTTTAKYYTPKGRCIHGTGIEPDVTVELEEGLEKKADLSKEEDNQLQKAVEVVKGIDK